MKVALITQKPFLKEVVEGIKKVLNDASHELIILEHYTLQSELINAVSQADAIIIRSDIISKEVIDAAENLKLVVRAGSGYDNVDLDACTNRNIVVMNTPGQNSNGVAELALGMMVYMARNYFDGSSGSELRGKKLGVHAFGNIGKLVAKIALCFGMDVYAFDPFLSPEVIERYGVKPVANMADLYHTCDYVSLHIPATKNTIKLINYDLLSKMPQSAVLINTARKEVVDEDSILQLFAERANFKYATDIRPDKHNEMAAFASRYFSTPKKMGAETAEANTNSAFASAKQIVKFFASGDRTFQVNK